MKAIKPRTWELWKWELQGEVDEKRAELDVVTWCGDHCPYSEYVKEDQYMISIGPFNDPEDMAKHFKGIHSHCDEDTETLNALNSDKDPDDDSVFVEYLGTIVVFHRKKA